MTSRMNDIFDDLADDLGDTHEHEPEPLHGKLADAAAARRFIRAGKAVVTLRSLKTGNHFTYKIGISDDGNCHFVHVLIGPDNSRDYKYLGRIARDVFWLGRKVPRPGDIGPDAPSAKAFAWTWRQLVRDVMPVNLEIWHEGMCGRCGRRLTVPESVASGFGPECLGKLGGP